jgi:hypothetical protein
MSGRFVYFRVREQEVRALGEVQQLSRSLGDFRFVARVQWSLVLVEYLSSYLVVEVLARQCFGGLSNRVLEELPRKVACLVVLLLS